MPAISYSKENIEKYNFANKILEGIKIHTIRRYRKKWIFTVGDHLVQYARQRSPVGFKIIENKCLYVADIKIELLAPNIKELWIEINGVFLNFHLSESLAKNDGFENYEDFQIYFIKSGLPFYGQIIGWKEGIDYGN